MKYCHKKFVMYHKSLQYTLITYSSTGHDKKIHER